MVSFIRSQRHNIERLLALVLLWNVMGGVVVTLGAPWLDEIAGMTGLRQPRALPSGSGWLAIGVPTHFAGIWLPAVGLYALYRMRKKLPWQLGALGFYAPQTFAIASPLHVDLWIGAFAATVFETTAGATLAVNRIAIALSLTHAGLAVWDSRLRAHERGPLAPLLRLARKFWGSVPLSRTALSRRYASIATVAAFVFLPLVPVEAFSPSGDRFLGRLLLLLPVTFVVAYVVAFVWSGGCGEPRFSDRRGVVATFVTYVHVALAADLLSRWLSDGRELLFRLFMVAWIFLLPLMLLLAATGALTGAWLGRKAASGPIDQRGPTRLTPGMLLTLATPLLALSLSYALGSPQRSRIDSARAVAQSALSHFDRQQPEQLYAMFTTEAQAMIDRDSFIAVLRERRDSAGALQRREELYHRWYPRAAIVQIDYTRVGAEGESSESIVIDVRGSDPRVAAVFMGFEGQPPAHNVFMPRYRCGGKHELLHCGQLDDVPPRSLF